MRNKKGQFQKGFRHTKESKEKMSKARKGENNPLWKGDQASYFSKHSWMRNNYGNPPFCQECGKKGEKNKGVWNLHWANISGEFRRDIKNWRGLCVRCHKKYDFDLPDYCRICNSPHYSKGFCRRCYNRNYWKNHKE